MPRSVTHRGFRLSSLLWILVAVAAALVALCWPSLRLRRALAQPFPDAWRAIVARNLPPFAALNAGQQQSLLQRVRQFLLEKRFFGCDGFAITDEVRLTIAANAALLLLNRPGPLFPGLDYVLVYPAEFLVDVVEVDEAGVEHRDERQARAGESWNQGKIILSWRDIAWDVGHWGDGQNVVLHELAHQLDEMYGGVDGIPRLADAAQHRSWEQLLRAEFDFHCAVVERADSGLGEEPFFDPYGASGPHEFFAVITEAFFEQPEAFSAGHVQLYEALTHFYGVDPRAWQLAARVSRWPGRS